ncbi:SRPBCC domain-containing protein [Chitinophagaceae bacterium LWZ2-11]
MTTIKETINKPGTQDYHVSFTVDATAQEVFNNINDVTKWWTENLEGNSHKLNDEFAVRFGDVHFSKQKLVEVVPNKKIVWLVTDSKLNFLENKSEWTNSTIVFEIESLHNGTQVHFTHVGLVPEAECYKNCTKGWDQFIKGSLLKLLTEGKGAPGLI